MKLALVISSLGGGGAERVMATLANAWVARGDRVSLITLANSDGDVYPLDPRIERVELGLARHSKHIGIALVNNWRRVRGLREAILKAQPDAVLSFMTNTNILAILSCWGKAIPVVVAERTSMADSPPTGLRKVLYRRVYRSAAAAVTLTKRGAVWLESQLDMPVHAIPNPLVVDDTVVGEAAAEALLAAAPGRRKLLAVGRLSPEKGFDLLLEAFSGAATARPEWGLVILGEGPERAALEAQVAALGLSGRVAMPGFIPHPQSVMRHADAFVLPSRFEGLPNALIEGMACGLPCVSFDCRTGPAELIQHGINGLLVPAEDVSALEGALLRLMGDEPLRKRLGEAARTIQSQLSLGTVLNQWDRLLTGGEVRAAETTQLAVHRSNGDSLSSSYDTASKIGG